jgi:hypothetical protein
VRDHLRKLTKLLISGGSGYIAVVSASYSSKMPLLRRLLKVCLAAFSDDTPALDFVTPAPLRGVHSASVWSTMFYSGMKA